MPGIIQLIVCARLVLDEPFSGLDLNHTLRLVEYIEQRIHSKKITIFSTHIPQYVARLARKTMFMTSGTLKNAENWNKLDFLARIELVESHFRVAATNK